MARYIVILHGINIVFCDPMHWSEQNSRRIVGLVTSGRGV